MHHRAASIWASRPATDVNVWLAGLGGSNAAFMGNGPVGLGAAEEEEVDDRITPHAMRDEERCAKAAHEYIEASARR
jgi:hypothetical protein